MDGSGAEGHDRGMQPRTNNLEGPRPRNLLFAPRSALLLVTIGAGLIVLLSGSSAGFGWALIVVGAALMTAPR
jgi:hypothetical protein